MLLLLHIWQSISNILTTQYIYITLASIFLSFTAKYSPFLTLILFLSSNFIASLHTQERLTQTIYVGVTSFPGSAFLWNSSTYHLTYHRSCIEQSKEILGIRLMVYNCASILQSPGYDYTCTAYVIIYCPLCKRNNMGEVDWNDVTHHHQIHGRT